MVKCVVSGCPNRVDGSNHGVFDGTQKQFFTFPQDPTRVKVWLAALRQADQQNQNQNLICEDHFLPEDILSGDVSADAIPIMPPCLDGPLDPLDRWGAGSEDDEDQWVGTAGPGEEEEDEACLPFNTKMAAPELPALDPTEQNPALKAVPEGPILSQQQQNGPIRTQTREDVSLLVLTRRFLDLFLTAPDGCLDLRSAIASLRTRRRRVYDITNVLQGVQLVQKESVNRIRWIGSSPASSYLGQNRAQSNMADLKLVEETLDSLIRTSAEQLFHLTDDPYNSRLAYVTRQDLVELQNLQNQTVLVVKAPEETKLEVPAPSEDSIQIHLKGGTGPIRVVTCDAGTTGEAGFSPLEESRIRTSELHTGSFRTKPGPPEPLTY
ncbi:transcription factor E2F6 isoform X1 [Poecilia formosa]|uniref:transcription factor E2F6 isoform X1 n=1 Tax=Poecilia formosa TaxID=48698 RepID=UPI0007BA1A73|nr:PREDICTED: transcription factor E2F6-like isoform X1 [Poecilia formosa]